MSHCLECKDYINGKKDGAIEELEKTKTEILKDYPYAENDNKANLTLHGIYLSLQYLDKHIAELKGENNE